MNFQKHRFFFSLIKERIVYLDIEREKLVEKYFTSAPTTKFPEMKCNYRPIPSNRKHHVRLENRHNKSRHLSEIILPFTFKLNRTRKNTNSNRFRRRRRRGRRGRKIVDLWLPKNNFTLSPKEHGAVAFSRAIIFRPID